MEVDNTATAVPMEVDHAKVDDDATDTATAPKKIVSDFSPDCPCCGDPYVDPRMVSCLHTLCMTCIKDAAVVAKEREEPMRCPIPECKTAMRTPDGEPCTMENVDQLEVDMFCMKAAKDADPNAGHEMENDD